MVSPMRVRDAGRSLAFPGKTVRVDTPCSGCGEPITIEMRDDQLLSAQPDGIVGYAYRPFVGPAQDPAPESRGFR